MDSNKKGFVISALPLPICNALLQYTYNTTREDIHMNATEGLKAVAERNNTARQRAVTALVRATGSERAIKVNEERKERREGDKQI